jgi:hypothetical protein
MEYCIVFNSTRSLFLGLLLWLLFPQLPLFVTSALAPASPVATVPVTSAPLTAAPLIAAPVTAAPLAAD